MDHITASLAENQRLAVTGSPGIGKSWLLHQFTSRLRDYGWVVATHYCFIDSYDSERTRRASIETTFGSIMAELLDADPSLTTDAAPRFAAGPRELQQMLDNAVSEKPDRRIAIIVDGLDHIDRLPDHLSTATARDLAGELAAIRLPPGVALVVGSQPGDHLKTFLDRGSQFNLRRWPDQSMRTLAERMGVVEALRDGGFESETEHLLDTIIEKADGNPLYATYLGRTAVDLTRQDTGIPPEGDLADYLAGMPTFDDDLNTYYRWLLDDITRDKGQLWVADLLALIDFPLSEAELGAIRPDFRHYLVAVLSRIAPVLEVDVAKGGIRIYHESFQRYVRELLENNPDADIGAILAPAVNWLKEQGFFTDIRSFRFLLNLLRRAGRDAEAVALVKEDFVAMSAAHCQPADAVQNNLAAAAASAAKLQDWQALAQLVELSRAADYLYQWRLEDHTLAEPYGRMYAELFSAQSLVDRLLHDDRTTFPARPGLILCQLCDEQGITAPWIEYRRAHDLQRQTNNTSYGSDSERVINAARLAGRFRINGRERSIRDCIDWLKTPDITPLHPTDLAVTLGEMYGTDCLLEIIDTLPSGTGRAWTHFALLMLHDDPEQVRIHAESAIREGLPCAGWRACLRVGADPHLVEREPSRLKYLSESVLSDKVQFEEDVLVDWLTEVELTAAIGDEAALLRTEASIPTDTWFRRWLKFCVILVHPRSTSIQIVASLRDLSHDIRVFEGKPRVVDLYGLHGEIQRSFRYTLEGLEEEEWHDAIDALKKISDDTTTKLQGSRSGPLPVDALLELVLSVADTTAKRLSASALGAELLSPEHRGGELYDTHAQDSLLQSRVHFAAGNRDLAETCWFEACKYLAGYGWRKDITVYELLDPIKALAACDLARARRCLHDVQHVVEGVLVHTDGKETGHAIHQWLDLAAELHPAGALAYLARSSISRVPDFGGFDHTLLSALAPLKDQIDPLVTAAGWIAAGYEARKEPRAAIAACETAINANPDAGRAIWSTVIASLDGDGVEPPGELKKLVEESAGRLTLPAPLIKVGPHPDNQEPRMHSPAYKSSPFGISHAFLSLLPVDASPLQLIHGVREWYNWRGERPHFEDAANAVGWRILEFVESGERTSAEVVIRRIARDTPRWDSNELLLAIAEGFAIRGESRLAALAYTYAYTRTRDGWRRFAGPKAEHHFLRAVDLDSSVAWCTLAEEVADSIAYGGEYGVTTHMIGLLAAAGRVDDAYAAWDSACRVVNLRVPATGPHDEIDILYDYGADDISGALAEATVARMNHYLLYEKRVATAGAALLAAHAPRSLAAGLRLAVTNNAPPSTLIALLHVMQDYEPEPYEATQAVAQELSVIAACDLVSARVLARRLLERAGKTAPLAPPLDDPTMPLPSKERISELVQGIGQSRIEPIVRIWPEFSERVAGKVDQLLSSEDLKERMQRAMRKFHPDRKERHLTLWLPVDEEIERILQTTGAAVRVALARKGILDPHVEEQVGLELLGDIEIGVRLVLSRIVRPEYTPTPSSVSPGYSACDVTTVPHGEHEGWVVAASRETELIIGDRYDKPVEARIQVFSGIVFAATWTDCEGLPLGYGQSLVWRPQPPPGITVGHFHGPLAGLEIVRDSFGPVEVLAPHPSVLVADQLVPARFECGLTLVDTQGEPAVVYRVWRQRLIGDEYPRDHQHRIEGMHLLIRSDIFESASARATEPAKYVKLVTHDREEGKD